MIILIPVLDCVTHKTNPLKVIAYKKALEKGAIFPPIEVVEFKGKYYVLDGAHRVAAHDCEVLAFVYQVEDCPKLHLLGSRAPKGMIF